MCLFLQINLKTGVPPECSEETCTAGAGTLLIEFGILGKLLDDPSFESLARDTVNALWKLRAKETGLLGLLSSYTFSRSCFAYANLLIQNTVISMKPIQIIALFHFIINSLLHAKRYNDYE